MQNPRTRSLRKNTGCKGRNGSTRATRAANKADRRRLDMAGHGARKDGLGTGIDRAEEKTKSGDSNGISNDVRNEPGQELENNAANGENGDEPLLTNSGREVREDEATQRDTALHLRQRTASGRQGEK